MKGRPMRTDLTTSFFLSIYAPMRRHCAKGILGTCDQCALCCLPPSVLPPKCFITTWRETTAHLHETKLLRCSRGKEIGHWGKGK